MRILHIAASIVVLAAPLAMSPPAIATDTQTAVGACINTPGCSYDCYPTSDRGVDCLLTAPNGTIIHCSGQGGGSCNVVYRPNIPGTPTHKPVNVVPIIKGKPIQAPPPKGGKTPPKHHGPITSAPIVNGKPVQKSPGTGTTQPILEKGSSSGGHSKH